MRHVGIILVVTVALLAGLLLQAQPASAAFHCMRIVAVMGGASGNANVQYVELRMTLGLQQFVAGHQMVFQDATGTEKAVFSFPTNVANPAAGASILVATQEFAVLSGMAPDFTFTTVNTVGSNGGDPLHPVQSTGGRVIFRANPLGPVTSACHPQDTRGLMVRTVDSVAYGAYPAAMNTTPPPPPPEGAYSFGTPAAALPTSGSQALVMTDTTFGGTLQANFNNDSVEYTVQTLPFSPSIPTPTPPTSPRNNADATGSVPPDSDQDLLGNSGDNCPSAANPGQENYDSDAMGNACDADDDDDGYGDAAESGTPLCGNAKNDDGFEDGVLDDGCPGGPAQMGAFSEAAFNLGTNAQGRCGPGAAPSPSPDWASDLISGSVPPSTDKITVGDLASFIAPVRRLNSFPPDVGIFNSRWDLVPGPITAAGAWINVQDMAAMTAGATGFPPMLSGQRAFAGPACSPRTHTVNMGEYWYGSAACTNDDSGACSTLLIAAGDSVQWTNVGTLGHTATHCPDNSLSTCATPPARTFDTSPPDGIGPAVAPTATSAPATLPSTGTFLYRCQLHPGPSSGTGIPSMRARIVVGP